MTRETKIGLLIGLGVILLIGIIVSDHLSVMEHTNSGQELTNFSKQIEQSIHSQNQPLPHSPRVLNPSVNGFSHRSAPQPPKMIPTPQELEQRPPITVPEDATAPPPSKRMPQAYANRVDHSGTNRLIDFQHVERQVMPATGPDESGNTTSVKSIPQPIPAAITSNHQSRSTAAVSSLPGTGQSTQNPGLTAIEQPMSPPVKNDWEHKVKTGESLYSIAGQYYGECELWHVIKMANRDKVGPKGEIQAGTTLIVPHNPHSYLDRQNTIPEKTTPQTNAGERLRNDTVLVRPGDTLSGIAESYLGSNSLWTELLAANRTKLSSPEELQAGMILRLPSLDRESHHIEFSGQPNPGNVRTYQIQTGDTLSSIAEKTMGHRDEWRKLYLANKDKLKDPDQLKVGDILRIPN